MTNPKKQEDTKISQLKIWAVIAFLAVILVSCMPLSFAQTLQPLTRLQNDVWQVSLDKQVQITADVNNGQDRDQPFAYIVQIKDQKGVVIQLSWLTGTLTTGQSLNPSQSWIPTKPGIYTAEIFVWNSIDNPDPLSPPLTMNISVT